MSDFYTASATFKQDKIILIAFSQFATQIAKKLDNPELAPMLVKILWERRNEFELLNPMSFDDLLDK